MSLENIRVVLVSPLYSGNVGAVSRAMANTGLSELVLVAPQPIDPGESRMMACHATAILEGRREVPTLAEAVADCGAVMGTSARHGLYRQHARTPREWAPEALGFAASAPVALVFGPEDNGLSNEDLALCTHVIQIPTTERFSSLNLAQAVMVCCYEIFVAAEVYEPPQEKSDVAASELRERMFAMWRAMLLETGFALEEKVDHMMLGVRRIFARGALTEDDVHIMMGVARQAMWASRGKEGRKPQALTGPQ